MNLVWTSFLLAIFFDYGKCDSLRTVVKAGKLLNQYGMIQAHDSATGEINDERELILAKWSRTQNGGIIDQLNCGARSLDYHPYLSESNVLFAHHGPVVVYKSMKSTLEELIAWGRQNPTELVVLSLSHCVDERFHNNYYSDSCHDAMLDLLKSFHIHTITDSDCSPLNTMTMENALARGNILALVGCSTGYWNPKLTCTAKDYVCYDSWPTNTSYIPWSNFENAVYEWSSFVPVDDGKFWGWGSNWQSSAESDIFGTLHNSSLILDEVRSSLNAWTAQAIREGKLKYLNILGVDNVCHNGMDIFEALQDYNSVN